MASRRNFPGRLELRRQRATERKALTAELTATDHSKDHTNTQYTNTVLIEASDSSGQRAQTRTAPIPPTLNQFRLSAADVARLDRLWFRDSIVGGRREFLTYLLLDVAVFWLIFHQNIHVSFGYIIGFLGFSFIFVIPFMIFWAGMGFLESEFYRAIDSDFARFYSYQEAIAAFEREKREYDAWLAKQREEYWRSLSGIAFERELGKQFSLMGYDVTYTPGTADGGVDLILKKDGRVTVVQCKAHKRSIPIGVVRELSASLVDFAADEAIIACFEGMTEPAADYARRKGIAVLTLTEILARQMKLS